MICLNVKILVTGTHIASGTGVALRGLLIGGSAIGHVAGAVASAVMIPIERHCIFDF